MTNATAAMYTAPRRRASRGLTRRPSLLHPRAMAGGADWTALRVEVASAAADAVVNFLVERGAGGVITDEADPGRTSLEAHVPGADGGALADALRAYLHELAALDASWSAGAVSLSPVPAVDWDAVFRTHHAPLAVGERLLVAPPWDVPAVADREVLVVEPGMAFGTGQHATTRTCLEEIEALVRAGGVRTALDVGTGSGILAAALVGLGVPDVVALDADVAVPPLARVTLERNGAGRVRLLAGTVAAVRGRFDLVVANILADTLIAEAAALAAAVAPGGRLVLSGLLAEQVPRVLEAYPGWRLAAERADDPWRTLRLVRSA
jgi:ribosomal protein L11 methyltransferase